MFFLFRFTSVGVIDLQHRENWKIIAREKEFSKTHLPDLFERIVNEVMPLLKQIVVNGGFPSETDLFANDKLRASVLYHFERLLCSFKECMEKISRINLAAAVDQSSNRPTKLSLNATGDVRNRDGGSAPIKDRKLLIVLSNCDYALRFSLLQCADRAKSIGARFSEQLKEVRKCESLDDFFVRFFLLNLVFLFFSVACRVTAICERYY